jgi:hypothetical protein
MSEDFMNPRGQHVDGGTDIVALDDVDLASDPFADDLSDQLAARAPRRYFTRLTVVLAGLVLLAVGFFAGAQVQKNFGTSAAASSGRNAGGAGGLAGGGNFAGFGGTARQGGQNTTGAAGTGTGATGTGTTGSGATGTAAAGNVTTGTVKLVDGTTVYVQTADGNVVTVKTNGTTAVQVTQSGALTDLTPGAQVNIEGAAGSDGTVTATKVTKAK